MIVAILQFNPLTGACSQNADTMLAMVKKAAAQGADLCIAPELALCGPNPGDLLLRREFISHCRESLEDLAVRLDKEGNLPPLVLGAPVSSPVPRGKPLHNCAVYLTEGKVSVISRKVILPSDNLLNDARYFESGISSGVLQVKGWRLVVNIGDDLYNNSSYGDNYFNVDPVAEAMKSGGGDVIVNLAARPFAQGEPAKVQHLISSIAQQYRVPVLTANIVGGFDGLVYHGGSLAFNGEGTSLAHGARFKEDIALVDLADTAVKGEGLPLASQEDNLWQAMVLGTRDFVWKSGFEKVVIGLSGGIDSALVCAVAAEAFGPDKVTGVLMPSIYSSKGSVDDSYSLAERLKINVVKIPIEPIMQGFRQGLLVPFGKVEGITEQNIQARIRGVILMAYANEHRASVLNTGNKSESACSFNTLYGDAVGAMAVIGDLYKEQVYAVSKWLNATRGELIPQAIIDKAPSAELAPGQKDSDSLPPYEVIDGILGMILEKGSNKEEIVEAGYQQKDVEKIFRLIQVSQFKREQGPTVLRVNKYALQAVWNTPIACKLECM